MTRALATAPYWIKKVSRRIQGQCEFRTAQQTPLPSSESAIVDGLPANATQSGTILSMLLVTKISVRPFAANSHRYLQRSCRVGSVAKRKSPPALLPTGLDISFAATMAADLEIPVHPWQSQIGLS